MSDVWSTKYRLLCERCDELVDSLGADERIPPAVLEEHTVRLLLVVLRLLRRHQVDRRGRCRRCTWSNRAWRFWRRSPQCTAFREVDLAMCAGLDVVWWQLFESVGRQARLGEVRAWISDRKSNTQR
jgi:hypothetical protein